MHRLLALSSSLIRHHLPEAGATASRNIITAGFSVLELLLQSVPTFVAKEIKTVLDLCVSVDSGGADNSEALASLKTASNRVISTATKKLPPQALYQALHELYSSKIKQGAPNAASVITILSQTIRQTSTRTVAEVHKSLFSQILNVLEYRSATGASSKVCSVNTRTADIDHG